MKNIFLLLILSINYTFVYGQNTFFKVYDIEPHNVAYNAIETSAGGFILTGKIDKSSSLDNEKGYAFKISPEGIKTKEWINDKPDVTSIFCLIQKTLNYNDTFLVVGTEDSISGDNMYNKVILYYINDDLEIVSKKEFPADVNERFGPEKIEIASDSIIYILSGYSTSPFEGVGLSVFKLKLPYDSLNSMVAYYNGVGGYFPCDLIYNHIDNKLNVFYYGIIPNKQDRGSIKIMQLDTNLQILNYATAPNRFLSNIGTTRYNDTSYLIAGTVSGGSISLYQHIMVYWMNNNDTIKGLEYMNNPDTILFSGAGENIITNRNNIFITGCYNFNPSQAPWQDEPTWIQITKTDMELNVINTHFYGGDAYYHPYDIIPTLDGGAFITGLRYNYTVPEHKWDAFALKVNEDGMVTDVPENASWKVKEALLYPNPGINTLYIQTTLKNATLEMYDANGRLVIQQNINETTTINTSALNPGMYFYRVMQKGEVKDSGKWVKQQ